MHNLPYKSQFNRLYSTQRTAQKEVPANEPACRNFPVNTL